MPHLRSRLDRLESNRPDGQRPVFILEVPDRLPDVERQRQTDEALQAAGYGNSRAIVIDTGIPRADTDRVQVHGPKWWQK